MSRTPDTKEPLCIKLGEPFNVTPDFSGLSSKKISPGGLVRADTVIAEIADFGRARVIFNADADFEYASPFETPSGSITVRSTLEDNSLRFDTSSLPISINVEVYDASEKQLDATNCQMHINEIVYEGELTRDTFQVDQREVETACFYGWVNTATREGVEVFFPQNSETFKDVNFIINQKR